MRSSMRGRRRCSLGNSCPRPFTEETHHEWRVEQSTEPYVSTATTMGAPVPFRELSGAFVVDPPGGAGAADRVFVITEWNAFRHPDFGRMKATMKQPVVFDGRNIFDPARLRELGFTYYGIGRP